MRKITLDLDEIEFNIFWRALSDRETKLLEIIEMNDEESDEALAANNDIIHLRCIKDFLREKSTEAGFTEDVFQVGEETMDIANL